MNPMRLPAEPYFSDSEIELETRPWVARPEDLPRAGVALGRRLIRVMGTALALGITLAVLAYWLDQGA